MSAVPWDSISIPLVWLPPASWSWEDVDGNGAARFGFHLIGDHKGKQAVGRRFGPVVGKADGGLFIGIGGGLRLSRRRRGRARRAIRARAGGKGNNQSETHCR
jgi:hypothetical protein